MLATVGSVLQARRRGLTGRWVDGKPRAGIVLTPVITVIVLHVLRVFIIAGTMAIGSVHQVGVSESLLQTAVTLLGAVLLFILTMFMGLLLGGLIMASQVLPSVLLTVSAGALGGYLLALPITHVWSLEPDRGLGYRR